MRRRKEKAQPAPEPVVESPHLIGYARVSTRDQDPQMQIDALLKFGVAQDDIYYETVSGASKRRPQFDAMMKDAREGDVIVFWKLDRLGRSVRQVLDTIAKLDAKGASIKCLTQPIDTTTPLGRLILVILAAVAEMERELGLERTRAGLARAAAEGRKGGATPKWSHPEILEFAKLGIRPGARKAGMSVPGFIKAKARAVKWAAEQEIKRRARRKRKA